MYTGKVVVITAIVMHAINLIVYHLSEDGEKFATALVFYPLYFLFTPIRRHKTYSASRAYYQKRHVSYWRYMILGRKSMRREESEERD